MAAAMVAAVLAAESRPSGQGQRLPQAVAPQ